VARTTTFKYTVTVSNPGSGNKYYIDGVLSQRVTLFPGCTYEFNQDDSSNSSHPLRFATAADAAGSTEYTTGVTTTGTPGSATAWTKIEVTGNTPYLLYYYCTSHSGMGSYLNVPPNYATGNRALSVSGNSVPGNLQSIDFFSIATTGNASDFGDMTSYGTSEGAGCGSSFTRAVIAHDRTGSAGPGANTSTQEQVTISSQGNSANFGNITANGENSSRKGGSNSIRGFCMGSFNSYGSSVPDTFATNDILFYTLATEGNTADFGDLTYACYGDGTSTGSSTRMVHAGGSYYGGSPQTTRCRNIIDYWSIASTGNATDFGDLSTARDLRATISNGVRSVMGGGQNAPADQGAVSATKENIIEYVTIASTGNVTDFGNLTVARSNNGGTSSSTRGVFMGGNDGSGSNVIDYITIASTSNATDFGDLTVVKQAGGSASDGHGGLQ